jgi:hypothetical protein
LSRVLSGLNAATTRNVISATMAHLIPCNGGSRFVFSHTFSDLLVGKMEATLEGQDINVRIRLNKLQNKIITWPDSLADDYIHRPIDNKLDQICLYNMTRCYKKGFNAFQKVHLSDEEENTYKEVSKSINSRKLILDSNSVI